MPCFHCHVALNLSAAHSARGLATQKGWPNKVKRRLGIPVESRALSNRRAAVRAGNARPHAWGRQRPQSVEDWQAWAFKREQGQWSRKSRAADDWEKGIGYYWRNRELNRNRSATRARMNYEKYKHTPEVKFKRAMRNAVKRITRIAKVKKEGRTIEFLGCTMLYARKHIEKQFRKGMHWNNHGTVWHIDHIVPLSKFDLTDAMQRKRANHFTNLQPLYVHENMRKGNKIMQPHQPALL